MSATYSTWFEENKNLLLEDFFTYLRFPSISTDPSHKQDVLACKDWLISYMKKIGLDVEVWETSGHPTVLGTSLNGGEGTPTLLFYGHYDVQPADPLEEWKSPPFEPEVREGKVYARGAIDNKGQGFYTLLAIRAFLERVKDQKVNIKVLIEGEEEVGSKGLEEIAESYGEKLKADHIFIVDLEMCEEGIPAVTLGIRGVTTINVKISNAHDDLHSGIFGGIALNPARALTTALGKMWDETGRVAIPGFYDGVKSYSKEELAPLDWDQDVKKSPVSLGVKAFQGEGGFSLLESNWIRPTLEINGIESGYTGEGCKTIIPKEATVKLSCRLTPGQDPEKVLNNIAIFLKKNLAKGIALNVEKGHGTPGFLTSFDSKTVLSAIKAYEEVYKTRCVKQLCGATIPIASTLAKVCKGDLVLMGVGLSEDHMHAPNECFGLNRLKEGFLSVSQILEIFSNGG